MQVVRNDKKGVRHGEKYMEKVLAKWLPGGPLPRVQATACPTRGSSRPASTRRSSSRPPRQTTPSSSSRSNSASASSCMPRVARPDIAYPVFRLCSAMSRPTPDLFIELNTLLSYLDYHKSLGITYDARVTIRTVWMQ